MRGYTIDFRNRKSRLRSLENRNVIRIYLSCKSYLRKKTVWKPKTMFPRRFDNKIGMNSVGFEDLCISVFVK